MMQNDFGLISIIMAAYNAEKTIEQAINSVLSQTYTNFELLVVNDCSTDRTAELVKSIAAKDSRVRLISNVKNSGVSYTRKHGLEEAKGSWISILDSDDAWAPEKLEKQIDLQRRTNADLLFTGSAFMDSEGHPIDWYLRAPSEVTYRQLLKQNVLSNSSALVRKELYAKNYAVGDEMHEDFAIWLSILKKGMKAYGVDEPLLIYRITKSSKSGNKFKAAKMNWNTYRYVGLNPIEAAYYEGWYMIKNVIKYTNLKISLMSVYHREKPEYLKQAIESIQAQTLPTDDFVLVCDGPLNDALDGVISAKQQEMGTVLNVVRLAKNGGLGNALNEGIKHCKNELVARMDSDDIAYPDRCEKQLAAFNEHPEVSICSGIVEEFTTDPNTVDAKRVPPETNAEIVEFAKKRNPFNHPCVMYKKSAVEAVGSYQDFYLLEDYYLWLRMLMAGYQGYNIQEPLLHMRAGSDMYLRRAGWKYAKAQAKLFKFMRQQGFIGKGQYIKSSVIRSGSALAPNWLRKFMFEKVLRK